MNGVQETVAKVCAIPVAFRRDPDATLRSLLEASGYERFRDQVTVAELQRCLATHPDLLEAWLAYSEGKQVKTGWYLEGLVVGYYQAGQGMMSRERFPDPARACAEFVKKEMDSLLG